MKGNKFLFKNFILAVLCFIGIFAFTPVQARAETVDLESNKQYTIELTGGTTKTMTYTMPKEGYFYIKVIPQYYTYEGETHFYIPDFFILSLNLEVEIKEGTNKHPKILAVDKVKEQLKDEVMKTNANSFNYIKIIEKNHRRFLEY
ncbi:MAG: hypothetical protein ACOCMX_07835, partial [Acetivibrio ethanolgignens]